MDRPSGHLGATTQLRGLPENPVHALRRLPPPTIPQVPPIPANLRSTVPSLSGFPQPRAAQPAPSHDQVLQLARTALENALRDNNATAGASGMGSEIKPGVTIDLSRNNIRELPEEVVDIINHELERLALSHNFLTTFPARFVECSSLRYLNIRNNQIKDFPLTICDIKSLEILDLGRNKLRALPQEIVKLSSLKVLAVQKNRIQELPLCLADMVSLQVLKLEGNDLTFPAPDVMQQLLAPSPPSEGMRESDHEVALTTHIKKYLRQRALSGRLEIELTGDESSEGTETPRNHHIRRAASGRFPIKVHGSDVPDIRSPNGRQPTPMSSRSHSHYRGLSQQSTAMRKPGIMPLTIGNPSERLRSNSEITQRAIHDRPESRNRRMGIVTKKPELTTLDEVQANANNRFSHYRGLSHGSAMQQGNAAGKKSPSPLSPGDAHMQRPIYVRRLSILPERRRESKYFDPVIEAAKGILYSVFQVHPTIQMLMSLTGDGTAKRSSLEIVFYNTNSHVEELEQEIQKHDPANYDENYSSGENENVYRACQALIGAYIHVCALLMENVDSFVDHGDPRYIRTLFVLLYNSIMELRVTLSSIAPHAVGYSSNTGTRSASTTRAVNASGPAGTSTISPIPSLRPSIDETIRPMLLGSRTSSRDAAMTPTADRPGGWQGKRPAGPLQNPSALRVTTDMPYGQGPFSSGRKGSMQLSSATPRSGESFASSTTSANKTAVDYTEEDKQFEAIFSSLVNSTNLMLSILPGLNTQLGLGLRSSTSQRAREDVIRAWKTLMDKTGSVIRQTELLKSRMSMVKLKDPAIRTHTAFWSLCNNFFEAWSDFGAHLKSDGSKLPLLTEHLLRLRPIHRSVKDSVDKMQRSPWGYFLRPMPAVAGGGGGILSPIASTHRHNPSNSSGGTSVPPHMIGVPATPQSASFSGAFNGGVFERADALLQQYGNGSGGNNVGVSGGSTASSVNGTGLGMLPRQGSLSRSHHPQSSTGSMSEMGSLNGMIDAVASDSVGMNGSGMGSMNMSMNNMSLNGILSPSGHGRLNGTKVPF
ncbi:Leucine-rich repeat-containing protein sog2 [Ceratocystis fimbriata CBS 114723]|uniref:Leucine-rich repeat-containing protein sog2 n=1 Tax=Ceratocystis fimbriata CBS 114723 TaxID=1035309 RepID=A0A2C5WYP5_9PEZI|nr:Leucine-rich repeat-containing protein sog2 [Ceratocystis fimbriata CBS 114723]